VPLALGAFERCTPSPTRTLRRSRPVSVVLAVVLSAHLTGAQGASGRALGVLAGSASTDSLGRHTLAGVQITIPALQLSTRTNVAGDYRLAGVTAGRHLIVAQAAGYRTIGDSITVAPAGETFWDIVFLNKVVVLDSVTSSARPEAFMSGQLRGFEERRHRGEGAFITQAEMVKYGEKRLGDVVVARLAAARLIRSGGGSYAAASGATLPGRRMPRPPGLPAGCYVTVYLDGALVYDLQTTPGGAPLDLNGFSASQFAGVEYYSALGTVPPQFKSSGCGVMLLWSRER
jgi:hypothetical protein